MQVPFKKDLRKALQDTTAVAKQQICMNSVTSLGMPCALGKETLLRPVNKNYRVWSEKYVQKCGRSKSRIYTLVIFQK